MLAYISYCTGDFDLVKPLLLNLGVMGYSVHFEQKMPVARMRWKDVLASIRDCDIFILALTPSTLKSESRTVEYDYAMSLRKPVLTVLLADVGGKIPGGYGNVLDYRAASRQNDLTQALKNLPRRAPAASPHVVIPDWLAPLTRVQRLITVENPGVAEQETIVFNVRETLERQETALAGELLLELFAARDDIDRSVQPEVQQIARQIRQSYARQRRTWWRNAAMVGVAMLAIMIVATFFLSRRLASANAAPATTALSQTPESTQEVATLTTVSPETTAEISPTIVPTLVVTTTLSTTATPEVVRTLASTPSASATRTPIGVSATPGNSG